MLVPGEEKVARVELGWRVLLMPDYEAPDLLVNCTLSLVVDQLQQVVGMHAASDTRGLALITESTAVLVPPQSENHYPVYRFDLTI